jgi:unsaturated chondroitin disaccharide hydrolase
MNDHDIGFNFMLSTVYAYRATGDTLYRDKAVAAARVLANRFFENGQYISVVGTMGSANPNVRHFSLIIDTLMNLPLLYWASEETDDPEFARRAIAHLDTTMSTVIREDGSTYQDYYFDPITGEPTHGDTRQGSKAHMDLGGSWSRGHAWGVYGFPIAYSYEKAPFIKEVHKNVSYFMLNHLPDDFIPYWDYDFVDGDEPRDSSAGVISACGFLEMAALLDKNDPDKEIFESAAAQLLEAVIDKCTGDIGVDYDGLICHVTHAKPQGQGIDECAVYGDFFYLEALARYLVPNFEKYW